MRTKPTVNVRELVLPGALFATAAVASAMAFAALSTPSQLETRLATVETDVRITERLARRAGRSAATPAGTVCEQSVTAQQRALHDALAAAAAARNVTVSSLYVGPDEDTAISQTLVALLVRVQASGSYEDTVALLGEMAQMKPTLFVESVDLTSKTSSVALSLTGRVFCVG